jgi:hypothetical protein
MERVAEEEKTELVWAGTTKRFRLLFQGQPHFQFRFQFLSQPRHLTRVPPRWFPRCLFLRRLRCLM